MPKTSTDLAIDLNQVSKTYQTKAESVYALKNVSIKVKKGEIVAIMGPSGSGKSTLMHIIAGLDRPTNGKVMVAQKSLEDLDDSELAGYRNQTIGFVFQFFYLQPYLDVVQNVEIPLLFADVDPKHRHKKAINVLKTVGLQQRLGHLPNQLSGGEMQRVAIARALVNDPAIILADEPTGNLDSKTGKQVLDYLLKARKDRGATIVLVTHDQKVAKMADRIIKIEDGKIK